MRNLIVCIAGLSGMLFSMAPEAATLTTSTYLIKISANCEEGVVVCDDITYVGTHRKNKKTIRLRGRDIFHYCPDDQGDGPGKTPCHHLGYEFRNGATVYRILDNGWLEVRSREKLIFEEQGKFDDNNQ